MSLQIKHALVLSTLLISSCSSIRPLVMGPTDQSTQDSQGTSLENIVEIKEMEESLEEVEVSKNSSIEEIKKAENKIVEAFEEKEEAKEEVVQEAVEQGPAFEL